ncbi:MAG: iron dependent repressor, metal binding and dimerization domain protein [Candidatus Latescibacterota bacterium]
MAGWVIGAFAGALIVAGGLGLFYPGWGLLWRWRRASSGAERARVEDTLKYLYESEVEGVVTSIQSVAGAARLSADEAAQVLQRLEVRRLTTTEGDGIRLTESGRELGLHVLRAHRLLEKYLADHTGFPEPEWHTRAHDLEHGLSPAEVNNLAVRMQHPTHDPHGDPIPTADGQQSGPRGVPLTGAPLDQPLRVLHLEDEPRAVYAQLAGAGLQPGMPVRLTGAGPEGVRLVAEGREHVLAPLVAASVLVEPVAQESAAPEPAGEPLSSLAPGESGRVLGISRRCRGATRRRLLDLGVLPGTVVHAQLRSPNGDPTAYRIRDALIALRGVQASLIRVERLPREVANGSRPTQTAGMSEAR